MAKKKFLFYSTAPLGLSNNIKLDRIFSVIYDEYNRVKTCLCTEERHKLCAERGRCRELVGPFSELDTAELLGLSSRGARFRRMTDSEKDNEILKLARKAWRRCRYVIITAETLPRKRSRKRKHGGTARRKQTR